IDDRVDRGIRRLPSLGGTDERGDTSGDAVELLADIGAGSDEVQWGVFGGDCLRLGLRIDRVRRVVPPVGARCWRLCLAEVFRLSVADLGPLDIDSVPLSLPPSSGPVHTRHYDLI